MKPLVTSKRVLQWLCVYPLDENSNKWMKWACIAFALYVFISNLSGVIASAIFVWKFISTELESCLFAIFHFAGWMAVTYMFVVAFIMRHEITGIIDQLSGIYSKYKDDDSFRYLAQANNIGEWIWQLFFRYEVCGYPLVTVTASALSVVICFIMNGHFDANYVYHTHKFSLPFNQSTLVGYVLEVTFSINSGELYFMVNGPFLILFITICLHHQAFYKLFRHSVRKFDESNKDRSVKKSLCDLIRFHNTTTNWFLESAKAFSPLIVIQLICGIMVATSIVFQFDLAIKHIDFTICILCIALVNSISNLFLYCFFGKLATESFLGMEDCLYSSNWYELPIGLQKYFIIMTANAQKPLYYHGFNIAVLNLETFCKMLKTVLSYYMMFKTLTLD